LELFNGETISVFVERLWQHRRPDGPYQSGGRFMEIAATDLRDESDPSNQDRTPSARTHAGSTQGVTRWANS
jgi:hypothetical protein